eukprot:12964556-Alexandrium_andersonii.AAC.1
MSASLVGSEMCIRDSSCAGGSAWDRRAAGDVWAAGLGGDGVPPVERRWHALRVRACLRPA